MGLYFELEHANFVAYLTGIERIGVPGGPKAQADVLQRFLNHLAESAVDTVDAGMSFGRRDAQHSVLSSRPVWIKDIAQNARLAGAGAKLLSGLGLRPVLTSQEVALVLTPLRPFFTGYALYGLVLAELWEGDVFFRAAALSSESHGLFMFPEIKDRTTDIVSAFPPLRALAETPFSPPVVVFWTAKGGTCVLPLELARNFYFDRLQRLLPGDPRPVDEALRVRAAEAKTKRILHVSDLHFGDAASDSQRRYIKPHLQRIVRDINRVVVTGDLINTPDIALMDQYFEFRDDIRAETSGDLIVIPGNHDVRPAGNVIPFVQNHTYELVADIGLTTLKIDDDLNCVFFCFNSNEEGNLARGTVTAHQLSRMGADYEAERARQLRIGERDLESYVKIALVHHHPYNYSTRATAWYDKLLRFFWSEETFIRLDEAELFLRWCAKRRVTLVMHGHKHVPHHVEATVTVNGAEYRVMVIGCGSTTGAERSALSYDIVSLNPDTGRWGVTFYQDDSRTGAGFDEQDVTIDLRRTPTVA